MNVAVLGGSFDPPHIGHFWLTRQVLERRKDIDKVILIPVNKHQWKPVIATPTQRLKMLDEFVTNNIEVSDIEIKRGGISYTEDTLKELKKEYQQIYWIVGSDILNEFNKWDKKDKLLSLARILVFPRDSYNLPGVLPEGFEAMRGADLITSSISSTSIKDRLKKGLTIKNFVPEKVEEFISRHKLYK